MLEKGKNNSTLWRRVQNDVRSDQMPPRNGFISSSMDELLRRLNDNGFDVKDYTDDLVI